MEAEHDDLQAVAAVGALEEAGLQEITGLPRREVDSPVGQAVAVRQNGGASIKTAMMCPTQNVMTLWCFAAFDLVAWQQSLSNVKHGKKKYIYIYTQQRELKCESGGWLARDPILWVQKD